MSETKKIPKAELGHVLAWVIVAFLSMIVFYVFLLVDILSRAGQPLIVEAHGATLLWVAALILSRISGKALSKVADRILEES